MHATTATLYTSVQEAPHKQKSRRVVRRAAVRAEHVNYKGLSTTQDCWCGGGSAQALGGVGLDGMLWPRSIRNRAGCALSMQVALYNCLLVAVTNTPCVGTRRHPFCALVPCTKHMYGICTKFHACPLIGPTAAVDISRLVALYCTFLKAHGNFKGCIIP